MTIWFKLRTLGMFAVAALLMYLTIGCAKQVKPDPELVLVKAPAEVRIEKVMVEVPHPIAKDVVKDYPCKYPENRPLSEFYTVNNAQHKCLKQYETLIDGLIKKYGVK